MDCDGLCVRGLYVHVILSDTRFGVGLGPLAELLLSLGEVLDMLRAPQVRRFQMQPFAVDQSKVVVRPPVTLVAQFGGLRPSFHRWIHVIRAESLPEEAFFVEVELVANEGRGCVLVTGRSDVQSGPDPIFHNSICLDWDDETDMAVNCKVIRSSMGFNEEPFAELREKLSQGFVDPVGRSVRLDLRCLDGTGTNAEISLHFAEIMPEASLSINISSATGLAPKSEAWTFNPFVEASIYSRDPRLGSLGRAAKVATGQTETLNNCHTDPHWVQPVVLKVVPEPDLFLRIVACSEVALGVTRNWDELADFALEFQEVMKLAQGSVERQFSMTRLIDMKRHGESLIFLSFAQVGGNVGAAAFETAAVAAMQMSGVGRVLQQADTRNDSPTRAMKHTTVQLPISPGYSLPPQPALQGVQPLGQVLQAHGQEVPDVIARLYGPPQEPRFLQTPAPPAAPPARALPPEEISEALQRASKAGAVVKGNVPMSFFNSPGNPHLAWISRP
eukprot:s2624_g3.t1